MMSVTDPRHQDAISMINERINGKDNWMKYLNRLGYYLPIPSFVNMDFILRVLKGQCKLLKKS